MKEMKKEEVREENVENKGLLKELFTKAIKTKIGRIISISILIVILLLIVLIIFRNPKEKVDSDILINTIKQSSELTTAEINYKGIAQFKDKGIVILNKSDFLMQYTATARIGIDLEEVEIEANNLTKTVSITIPHAKVLDIKIDPSKIKYYDEKFSLFNFNKKEDANKAQELAEKSAKEEIKNLGVIKMADDQAATLIKGLIHNLIPDNYDVEIKTK